MAAKRSLTRRQKAYWLIIIVLLMCYVLNFSDFDGVVLPTGNRINDQKKKIKQLNAELLNLEKLVEKRHEKKLEIKGMSEDFWFSTDKVPTNVIQQRIERIGKKTGVTLNKVGAPKIVDISENIQAVDITISSTTSIKNISDFLREIENNRPVLVWNNCIIRPNRTKEPTAVNLAGKLRAYVMGPAVSTYLSGTENEPK